MEQSPQHRQKAKRLTMCFGITTVLILLACGWGLDRLLYDRLTSPLQYQFRNAIGAEPTLSDNLKIFVFDSKTLNALQRPTLTMSQWDQLLRGMADSKPRAILIDSIFSMPDWDMEQEAFAATIASLSSPVYAGAFVSQVRLSYNVSVGFDKMVPIRSRNPDGEPLPWLPTQGGQVYGPHAQVSEAYTGYGHIAYKRPGFIKWVERLSDHHALPHLALYGAPSWQLGANGVKLGDDWRSNQQEVNLLRMSTVFRRSVSLKSGLARADAGQPFSKIDSDDVVLILPAMYTGHTDWVDSPLGLIPGGIVLTSAINNLLNESTLATMEGTTWFFLLWALLGAALGCYLSGISFWLGFSVGGIALIATGLFGFSHGHYTFPWLTSMGCFGVAGLTGFAWRSYGDHQELKLLKNSLAGIVPAHQLRNATQFPGDLGEPVSRLVTIMFIDIVGFSKTIASAHPERAFLYLREFIHHMTTIILKHGGIIDKTLGDGILCTFGYTVDGSTPIGHVDNSLLCAEEIQNWCLDTCLERDEFVFPVRIGMNTATVTIGNLGDQRRYDFTMIGDGVNYAARLESSCEPFRIMVGAITHEMLSGSLRDRLDMKEKLIRIKHNKDLSKAYEIDPHVGREEDLSKARIKYLDQINVSRKETRFTMDAPKVTVRSSLDKFDLIDYSESGFAMLGRTYCGSGVTLEVYLEDPSAILEKRLLELGVSPIEVEIRWGVPRGNAYLHGVQIVGLNVGQKKKIIEALHQCAEKNSIKVYAS